MTIAYLNFCVYLSIFVSLLSSQSEEFALSLSFWLRRSRLVSIVIVVIFYLATASLYNYIYVTFIYMNWMIFFFAESNICFDFFVISVWMRNIISVWRCLLYRHLLTISFLLSAFASLSLSPCRSALPALACSLTSSFPLYFLLFIYPPVSVFLSTPIYDRHISSWHRVIMCTWLSIDYISLICGFTLHLCKQWIRIDVYLSHFYITRVIEHRLCVFTWICPSPYHNKMYKYIKCQIEMLSV